MIPSYVVEVTGSQLNVTLEAGPTYVVEVTESQLQANMSVALGAPAVVEVQVPGLRGPPGDAGIIVSSTPPVNPVVGTLWLDIS